MDEKWQICEDKEVTSAAIDAAMRSDFEALLGFAKKKLLDMLGAPGTKERDWWERVLLGFGSIPDQPPVSA